MNASNQPPPLTEQSNVSYAPAEYQPTGPHAPLVIDPNNPPWGVTAGILTWVGSVLLIIGIPVIALIFYILAKGPNFKETGETILQDKTAVFISIASTIPAHLLTFFVIWAVVTHFGKRPFWSLIGWSWSNRVGFWTSAGLAIALLLVGFAVGNLIKGQPTEIDQIVNSSLASRYALAFIAAITAPLIEELVYRGVLYSALQKAAGKLWAIVTVSALFALVHVWEYRNNIGVIAAVSILSISLTLLRAYSGRLLPCFIVHLIFNGIQAIYIVIEPHLPQSAPDLERKAPAIAMLCRSVRAFF